MYEVLLKHGYGLRSNLGSTEEDGLGNEGCYGCQSAFVESKSRAAMVSVRRSPKGIPYSVCSLSRGASVRNLA